MNKNPLHQKNAAGNSGMAFQLGGGAGKEESSLNNKSKKRQEFVMWDLAIMLFIFCQ